MKSETRATIGVAVRREHSIIAKAIDMLSEAQRIIRALQKRCPHDWRFSHQVNAYHITHWYVVHSCAVCKLDKIERWEPICEHCPGDVTLTRIGEIGNDSNRPVYRCPKCKKPHSLHILGD